MKRASQIPVLPGPSGASREIPLVAGVNELPQNEKAFSKSRKEWMMADYAHWGEGMTPDMLMGYGRRGLWVGIRVLLMGPRVQEPRGWIGFVRFPFGPVSLCGGTPLNGPVEVDADAIPNAARVFLRQGEHKRVGLPKADAFWPNADTPLWLAEVHHIRTERKVLVVFGWVPVQKLKQFKSCKTVNNYWHI